MRRLHLRVLGLVAPLVLCAAAGCGDDETSDAAAAPLLGNCIADCSAVPTPACFVAQCNGATGQCEIVPSDTGGCDDGLFCTVGDHCQAGRCVGDPNSCGLTAPACKVVACDEGTRSCHLAGQPDGTTCTDGDVCSVGGACVDGTCVPEAKTCRYEQVGDECHVAECNPATGACDVLAPGNEGAPCTSDPCVVFASCHDGSCHGGMQRDCTPWADACHTAACDAAHGGCYGVPAHAGAACSEGDACNRGACDPTGACVLTARAEGASCSDGLGCTSADVCASGRCIGTGAPTVYFRDTFASNAQGWTTSGTWMIGPTRDVSSFPYSSCKPEVDHTGFGDNGVATTALGGHDGFSVHDFTYLTSPVVDTSSAATLRLQFAYLLSWMAPPLQEAVVEVWDGATWVRTWESLGSPDNCRDDDFNIVWQKMDIDVSAHKNAAMRVRFGVASRVVQPNVGWTLDDLALVSASCN